MLQENFRQHLREQVPGPRCQGETDGPVESVWHTGHHVVEGELVPEEGMETEQGNQEVGLCKLVKI